jgi:hypothetical protein
MLLLAHKLTYILSVQIQELINLLKLAQKQREDIFKVFEHNKTQKYS